MTAIAPTAVSINGGGRDEDGSRYGLASAAPRVSAGNVGGGSGGGGGGRVENPAPSRPFSLDTEMNWTATGELVPRRHFGAGGGLAAPVDKVCCCCWWCAV